jgi:hypothetical protein
MDGVPSDLPLGRFVGYSLNQIALGRFQLPFHFTGAGSICAESRWELRGPSGDIVDAACEHAERDSYRVHQVIDVPVVRLSIDAPRSFTLFFESGDALTFFDDSERYESLAVHLEGTETIFIYRPRCGTVAPLVATPPVFPGLGPGPGGMVSQHAYSSTAPRPVAATGLRVSKIRVRNLSTGPRCGKLKTPKHEGTTTLPSSPPPLCVTSVA